MTHTHTQKIGMCIHTILCILMNTLLEKWIYVDGGQERTSQI